MGEPFDLLGNGSALRAGGRVAMPTVGVRVLQILFLATTARLLGRCLLFEAGELDYRELRRISATEPILHHSRITARALFVARRDLIEEFLHHLMRLDVGERAAARGKVVLFAERHHPIGEAAELLGLRIGSGNFSVLHQREEHILEQGLAMSRGPVQLSSEIKMTH